MLWDRRICLQHIANDDDDVVNKDAGLENAVDCKFVGETTDLLHGDLL